MAYSFTEPIVDDDSSSSDSDNDDEQTMECRPTNPPMMVPVADILNHVAANNARLDFGTDSLKMVATQAIAAVL